MSSTAIALLHGFTGTAAGLEAVASPLRERGFRVEVPSLLGHGAPDDEDVRDFEGEVHRLARHLGRRGGPYHLVGYSLGGRLAVGLLCRHPELFSGATVVSAQPGLTSEQARAERRFADERWCEILETQGIHAFVDAWERVPLFATQAQLPEETRSAQRQARLSHSPAGLVRSLRVCGLGNMPAYWDVLREVRLATTLVVGGMDEKFFEIAVQMSKALPRASTVVVPEAGHNVLVEAPRAVVELVSRAAAGAT